MVVAVPVYEDGTIFPNASYAPRFAVYNVEGNAKTLIRTVRNPRAELAQPECLSVTECECPEALTKDTTHILSHYHLVEILHDCDVVLAKAICGNTKRIFEYVGIRVYKIPPIINQEQHAINNYIVGVNRENNL